jgi:hypothetical protein
LKLTPHCHIETNIAFSHRKSHVIETNASFSQRTENRSDNPLEWKADLDAKKSFGLDEDAGGAAGASQGDGKKSGTFGGAEA